ncbi:phytanoyl-CoA dioxygenase family protein [Nonomuraea sp. PA05]|uniref:phytanoyl-CoA dioxygenase family protein n=1 Tax=Nonomuraea sp. PA05 TaxID=2604466 RepID=UPI0011D356C9|nr:phytanoyl-CoA dioxygenase family protein [Nonomuraea sp. PA05]TYB64253.1 phytanoyl-CoA dioxygenase family protein [Nonomuraea sp. PA05]
MERAVRGVLTGPPATDRRVGVGRRAPAPRPGVTTREAIRPMDVNAPRKHDDEHGHALRTHYDEHGYARLDRAFPATAAAEMAGAVWSALARKHGIDPKRPSTWTPAQPGGLGRLSKVGVFDRLGSPAVVAAIGALLGRQDWPRPGNWGGPLVTFPTPGPWEVPTGGWHLDFPARGANGVGLLLKWLGYLAPVGRGGGGTVVLSGSHRLVARFLREAGEAEPGRSPAVRDAVFGMDPRLRDLRGRPEVTVSGIPVRVVELTGEPGDVVFLHPHLLHAPAPNRSGSARLMVTGGLLV